VSTALLKEGSREGSTGRPDFNQVKLSTSWHNESGAAVDRFRKPSEALRARAVAAAVGVAPIDDFVLRSASVKASASVAFVDTDGRSTLRCTIVCAICGRGTALGRNPLRLCAVRLRESSVPESDGNACPRADIAVATEARRRAIFGAGLPAASTTRGCLLRHGCRRRGA
jgi:ribosomal protein S14